MKGIVLAGGAGTRLYPITKAVNKHLLPVYDKPMIYYPISILKNAGIKDIMIITTSDDLDSFYKLLGTGEEFGLHFSYKTQENPNGIAEAFLIASKWIGDEDVCLILGDNIFSGGHVSEMIKQSSYHTSSYNRAQLIAYPVADPERYGVIKFKENETPPIKLRHYIAECIIEKPTEFVSEWAVVGVYCYPNDVVKMARTLTPSARGELEITDLNNLYMRDERCVVSYLNQDDTLWIDTGTHDSLIEASMFVKTIQDRTNIKVGEL